MSPEKARTQATTLMHAFAARTGLDGALAPHRYLWTDAFAACNFLALGDTPRAARLVQQVHAVLGRHRGDDGRAGPLSGLDDAAAARHPTAGGLRVGKPLPERGAGAPPDPEREWDRDGQYFHYLTRWMHALDQFGAATAHADANRWARELADTAHRAFTDTPGAPRRMAWKMSLALDRPQVATMGQHDPLDGLVTCLQLRAHRAPGDPGPDLAIALRDFAALVPAGGLATTDPLGLGGLLGDAWRLAQLRIDGTGPLLAAILAGAAAGLAACLRQGLFAGPAPRRLAFRELGLAIGLAAVPRLQRALEATPQLAPDGARASVDALAARVPLAQELTTFWREPARQVEPSWCAHQDINAVMLATALVPDGYLDFAGADCDGAGFDGTHSSGTQSNGAESNGADANGADAASPHLPRR